MSAVRGWFARWGGLFGRERRDRELDAGMASQSIPTGTHLKKKRCTLARKEMANASPIPLPLPTC
jgi:hypothetical protein